MKKQNIRKLAYLGALTAILLIFSFTPIGYLHIGTVEITFNMIPVILGATTLGALGGTILGTVFAVTSFIQCFGMSEFGTLLFGVSPILTFVLCFVPRMIAGFLPAIIYKSLVKKNSIAAHTTAALSGSLLNTILFTAGFCLMFRGTMLGMAESQDFASPMAFLAAAFIINGAIEAVVCTVVCVPIGKATEKFLAHHEY